MLDQKKINDLLRFHALDPDATADGFRERLRYEGWSTEDVEWGIRYLEEKGHFSAKEGSGELLDPFDRALGIGSAGPAGAAAIRRKEEERMEALEKVRRTGMKHAAEDRKGEKRGLSKRDLLIKLIEEAGRSQAREQAMRQEAKGRASEGAAAGAYAPAQAAVEVRKEKSILFRFLLPAFIAALIALSVAIPVSIFIEKQDVFRSLFSALLFWRQSEETPPLADEAGGEEFSFQEMARRLRSAQSASFDAELKLVAAERGPSAEPIPIPSPPSEDDYEVDKDRFGRLAGVRKKLDAYYEENGVYPFYSDDAGIYLDESKDHVFSYKSINDGADYVLRFTFRTREAVEAIQNNYRHRTRIEGMDVFFGKDSDTEFSFAGLPDTARSSRSLFRLFPADIRAAVGVNGAFEYVADGSRSSMRITADARSEDFDFELDAGVRRTDDGFFVRMDRFPVMFWDTPELAGQWVKAAPEDIRVELPFPGTLAEYWEVKDAAVRELGLLFRIADEEELFAVRGVPVAKDAGGLRRYDFGIDAARFMPFLERASAELERTHDGVSFFFVDRATLPRSEESADALAGYFEKNASVSVWAGEDGFPAKASFSLLLVPRDEALGGRFAGRELRISGTISFRGVNEPAGIEAPQDPVVFGEVVDEALGLDERERKLALQIRRVRDIRRALEAHRLLAGEYPDLLPELEHTAVGLGIQGPKAEADSEARLAYVFYRTAPFLEEVPLDALTGEQYYYTKDEDGKYRLSYTMEVPPYEEMANPSFYYEAAYQLGEQRVGKRFVDGENTASPASFSNEAAAQLRADADGDTLADSFEDLIGTDKLFADTDGDAASDWDEVRDGTDPLDEDSL